MLFSGSNKIKDIYSGSTPVQMIYSGSNLIWRRTQPVQFCSIKFSNNPTFEYVETFSSMNDDGRVRTWSTTTQSADYWKISAGDYLASGLQTGTYYDITFSRENASLTYINGSGQTITIEGMGVHSILVDGDITITTCKGLIEEPLCFTAQASNDVITLQNVIGDYEYSTNGTTWDDYTIGTPITLANSGDKVYFRAYDTNSTCYTNDTLPKFSMTQRTSCSGNIMSLLDKTCSVDIIPPNCFKNFFQNQSNLTSSPKFSCWAVGNYGCQNMMRGTSISSIPTLPATTVGNYCYDNMFRAVPITEIPNDYILPAKSINVNSYQSMFSSCSNLSSVNSNLFCEVSANGTYGCYQMFFNCKNLENAPILSCTQMATGCYNGMFQGCEKLTTAPSLPATNLTQYCYSYMFSGCKALTSAPTLPASTIQRDAYKSMFSTCTSLTTAEFPNMTIADVTELVANQTIFVNAANDILVTCSDGQIIVND